MAKITGKAKASILTKASVKTPVEKARRLVELQAIYRQIKPEIDILKAELLSVMQSLDVFTLKTGSYTISRAQLTTPQVEDFNTLKKSLKKMKIPFDTVEVFADYMRVTFKKLVDEGCKVPGLSGKQTEYVTARPREKKEGK